MEIKDFEQALGRLAEIVDTLEKGELSLEEAMGLFEEGMKLSGVCGNKLTEAERKVEMLIRDGRGRLVEQSVEIQGGEESTPGKTGEEA